MKTMWSPGSPVLLSVFLAFLLMGCSSVEYLFQATHGQMQIFNRSRPIAEVLKDERTPPAVRGLLAEVRRIKLYGERYGIKPTSNYESYVDLERKAAVWVVSGSPRLKLEPRRWSFPIVGSFTYMGWFDRENALHYAEALEAEENIDVDVRGAMAYSTLGWFRDPILSTMLPPPEEGRGDFVNVLIHESVHATLYINHQSNFNESLANFVAHELTQTYFKEVEAPGSKELALYLKSVEDSKRRRARFREVAQRLKALYESSVSESEMLAQKKKILDELTAEMGYKRPVTNATLVQFLTYNHGLADFEFLYNACGRDWPCFWGRLRTLNEGSFPKEQVEDFGPIVRSLAKNVAAD